MKRLLEALARALSNGAVAPPTACLLDYAWLAPHAAHVALIAANPAAHDTSPTPLASDRSLR